MIADHSPVRLRWDGRTGVARHDGVEVQLRERPAGMIWREVDYVPGEVAQCRDRDCDPMRELHGAEIDMIRSYLAAMAQRTRGG